MPRHIFNYHKLKRSPERQHLQVKHMNDRLIKLMQERHKTINSMSYEIQNAGIKLSSDDFKLIRAGTLIPSYAECKAIADILGSTVEFLFPYFDQYPDELKQFVNLPKPKWFEKREDTNKEGGDDNGTAKS